MNKYLKPLLYLILFIFFLKLIVNGQKNVTLQDLGKMLVGLFGLIGLLWAYNRGQQ
ncbi:DUF6903 family protein [Streptobacillus canis]|uniref:DUF6903 family protein n=1 Tax=Streptobacillus canis TaxID=2678686 RepID=UPI0018CC3B71|nr:hypothetical protein [Streptobacillus canis]